MTPLQINSITPLHRIDCPGGGIAMYVRDFFIHASAGADIEIHAL